MNRVEALGGDRKAWAQPAIMKGFTAIEALLEETAGKYCVGDEITLADVFLAPQLFAALRFEIDVENVFPRIFLVNKNI